MEGQWIVSPFLPCLTSLSGVRLKVKVENLKFQIHAVSPCAFLGLPTQEKVEELWGRIKDRITWTGFDPRY